VEPIVGNYARRWHVENGIAEAVKFFHLNALLTHPDQSPFRHHHVDDRRHPLQQTGSEPPRLRGLRRPEALSRFREGKGYGSSQGRTDHRHVSPTGTQSHFASCPLAAIASKKFQAVLYDKQGKVSYPSADDFEGTFGWTQRKFKILDLVEGETIELRIGLQNAKGTMYVDETKVFYEAE